MVDNFTKAKTYTLIHVHIVPNQPRYCTINQVIIEHGQLSRLPRFKDYNISGRMQVFVYINLLPQL